MLNIYRKAAINLITWAINSDGKALVGLLSPQDEDCRVYTDSAELRELIKQNDGDMVVYNQHPKAVEFATSLFPEITRTLIEIRQDTKGVLGLQARSADGSKRYMDYIENQ
jgi:hypothetical protein